MGKSISSLHQIIIPSTNKRPQCYLIPYVNTLLSCSILGRKWTIKKYLAAFSIDTQGKILYTSTHKKAVLITNLLHYHPIS